MQHYIKEITWYRWESVKSKKLLNYKKCKGFSTIKWKRKTIAFVEEADQMPSNNKLPKVDFILIHSIDLPFLKIYAKNKIAAKIIVIGKEQEKQAADSLHFLSYQGAYIEECGKI